MRKGWLVLLAFAVAFPGIGMAQQAGSFVLGLDIGLTSPVGDFATSQDFLGRSGFGLGSELRFHPLSFLSFGPFVRYHRFSSNLIDERGHVSYNFTQYGAKARLNFLSVQKGRFFVGGGGGIFTPKTHYWAVNDISDEAFEQGTFFSGCIGLCSDPHASVIYELEATYSTGKAAAVAGGPEFNFDFVLISMRLSFNSKGAPPSPRY